MGEHPEYFNAVAQFRIVCRCIEDAFDDLSMCLNRSHTQAEMRRLLWCGADHFNPSVYRIGKQGLNLKLFGWRFRGIERIVGVIAKVCVDKCGEPVTTTIGHCATEELKDSNGQLALAGRVQQLNMCQTTINVHESP